MSDNASASEIPTIYNLFPKLVGDVGKWFPHVERAADMGFNWLFLNPIHLTGASGSLYSIRDYFRFSPVFFPGDDPEEQKRLFQRFVDRCRERGVEVMVDLVINHTAIDSPLVNEHPAWYQRNEDGSFVLDRSGRSIKLSLSQTLFQFLSPFGFDANESKI